MYKEATQARIDVINDTRMLQRRVENTAYHFWKYGGERIGQAVMNALDVVAPDLYEIVSGSPEDCFYTDSLVVPLYKELGFYTDQSVFKRFLEFNVV